MENQTQSLFAAQALEAPCDLAAALALASAPGHLDELHGRTVSTSERDTSLSAGWSKFFNFLGSDGFNELDQRTAQLQRQIRDNGVTYNVYADADGPQRPWLLDLFPMMVSAQDWTHIQAGIKQRARLLDRVMADIYGPQQLLEKGLLPSALVHGHPGYLRAMRGVQPAGGTYLHIAAFDIAHGPDGQWSVVSQRTQSPSGLGYLLENRRSISLLFPEAFREMEVQHLAASYKVLIDGLKAMSPAHESDSGSRVVLLTPGPYNETYFEHAYLARFLGLTLVEGSDLMVRNDRLYLKTLRGLEPVHGLLKRLDDEFLDPLELRSDSTLGVPGLLQVIRAGNVRVVNTPGSAFLESTALLGFLPALSKHLLGEALTLPSLATWWCGEQAILPNVLSQLKKFVIKPTYPGSGMASVIGPILSERELSQWAGRIASQGEAFTVQAYLPLSQTPTWQDQRIAPRSAMLRVFAVADGAGSWQVLPGGLARLAGENENMASMQYGGSSADVWVLGAQASVGKDAVNQPLAENLASGNAPDLRAEQPAPAWSNALLRHRAPVTSRAAENLFWLGRYTERAENSTRLARLTLQCLGGEDQTSQPLLAWLTSMAVGNALVLDSVPPATQSRRIFKRALVANLTNTKQAGSVGSNLKALKNAASAVRERLSQEQWSIIMRAEIDFFDRCNTFKNSNTGTNTQGQGRETPIDLNTLDYSSVEALSALESASGFLAAITGAQTDRMTRDDGWRLLSVGRLIERLNTLAAALVRGFETKAVFEEGGFSAMIALFDSTITFHAQYQERRDIPALLDLLVLDSDNPRALSWVLQALRGRLAKLATGTATESPDLLPDPLPDLSISLPDTACWLMTDFYGIDTNGTGNPVDESLSYAPLMSVLEQCCEAALELSNDLGRRYFSHSASGSYSLGA